MPHTDPEITRTRLSRNALLVLDDAQGMTVAVDAGVIWLTLDSDPRDVFLRAGERFCIDRSGRTVIMAHEAASLRVLPRPSSAGARMLRAIFTTLARSWRRIVEAPARRTVPYY